MFSEYSKFIVTGANGWLGSRIILALTEGIKKLGPLELGDKSVRCILRPGENASKLLNLGVEVHYGDILDIGSCKRFLRDSEHSLIIHTAGIIHPKIFTKDFYKVNVMGTMNLIHSAAEARSARVIIISSNSPIGTNARPDEKFTESAPYKPYMSYGKSKHIMEIELSKIFELDEYPDITIIRPPWFYGPGQPPRQTEFFRMVKDGKFPLMGKGLNRRSMVFIDNLVLGVLLAAKTKSAAGEIYWISDEKPYPMIEIVSTIKTVLSEDFGYQVNRKNLHLPESVSDLARLTDQILQGLGLYSQKIHVLSEMNKTIACDISKAKKELGYKPVCELKEGMRESIEWCLRNGFNL